MNNRGTLNAIAKLTLLTPQPQLLCSFTMLLPAETAQPLQALTASSRLATSSMVDQACSINQPYPSMDNYMAGRKKGRKKERKKESIADPTGNWSRFHRLMLNRPIDINQCIDDIHVLSRPHLPFPLSGKTYLNDAPCSCSNGVGIGCL